MRKTGRSRAVTARYIIYNHDAPRGPQTPLKKHKKLLSQPRNGVAPVGVGSRGTSPSAAGTARVERAGGHEMLSAKDRSARGKRELDRGEITARPCARGLMMCEDISTRSLRPSSAVSRSWYLFPYVGKQGHRDNRAQRNWRSAESRRARGRCAADSWGGDAAFFVDQPP